MAKKVHSFNVATNLQSSTIDREQLVSNRKNFKFSSRHGIPMQKLFLMQVK